tara:strand:+ start:309 stop:602 length:294 start_codon:yes stop_codon:yes gene_type:complete
MSDNKHEIAVIKKDSDGLSTGLSAISSGPTIDGNGKITVAELKVNSTLTYGTLDPAIPEIKFNNNNLTKIEYSSNRLKFFNGGISLGEFEIGSVIPK